MPDLAVWALQEGFDGPALRELAGLTTATHSGEQALIDRALRELGKEKQDASTAIRVLAVLLCQRIVAGEASPYEGAKRIWTACHQCGMPESLCNFVGYASEWENDASHRYHYVECIVQAARELLQNEPSS